MCRHKFLNNSTHQRHQRDAKSRGPTNNIGLKIHPTVWAGLFIWAHHRAPPYQTERAMAKELELGLQGSHEWLFASNQRKPLAEGFQTSHTCLLEVACVCLARVTSVQDYQSTVAFRIRIWDSMRLLFLSLFSLHWHFFLFLFNKIN